MDESARKLQQFKDRRSRWLEHLAGNHPNSIRVQLAAAFRRMAFFETVKALSEGEKDHTFNRGIAELFTLGYFFQQSLAVRRLTDRAPNTYSIWAIVGEIKKHRNLLTREHLVRQSGAIYDLAEARRLFESTIDMEGVNETGERGARFDTVAYQRFSDCERAHETFDRLCLTDPALSPASPSDRVAPALIEGLIRHLEAPSIEAVTDFTHKFAAHAAIDYDPEKTKLRPADVRDALERVAQVYAFLRTYLFQEASLAGLVPTPQYDNMKNLCEPIVPFSQVAKARETWRGIARSIDEVIGHPLDRFFVRPKRNNRLER